jgi:CheY-like chemotaxis protein
VTTPIEILLVEDNPGDADLTRDRLESAMHTCRIHQVVDGIEALQFVRREGRFVAAPRPDLILLDLNLPRMDGRETLQQLKTDPSLRLIPVIVLTSSEAERDISASYQLGTNAYVCKAATLASLDRTFGALAEFWLSVAKLPQA